MVRRRPQSFAITYSTSPAALAIASMIDFPFALPLALQRRSGHHITQSSALGMPQLVHVLSTIERLRNSVSGDRYGLGPHVELRCRVIANCRTQGATPAHQCEQHIAYTYPDARRTLRSGRRHYHKYSYGITQGFEIARQPSEASSFQRMHL
jgi:hypothetical protein